MATFHHVIIPLESYEQMVRTRDFFINIMGFKLAREAPPEGNFPKSESGEQPERNRTLPDFHCHLVDENGFCIDLVAWEGTPVLKGVVLGLQVEDINESWDSLKDYPVKELFSPAPYPENVSETIEGMKSGAFAFFGLEMGRISDDGTEQVIELIELNFE